MSAAFPSRQSSSQQSDSLRAVAAAVAEAVSMAHEGESEGC